MSELDFHFALRFLINIISICALCYGSYYRANKNSDVAGSFLLFGVGIFIITFLLHGVDMSMEFAFGLFAVFTMLRYRTESISIKEMTYLFLVTAIALLTSVAQMNIIELLLLNSLICIIAFIVDTRFFRNSCQVQTICYEKIENINIENRDTLLQDLHERTGLNIVSVEILHIDFMRDSADIKVVYLPNKEASVASNKLSSHTPAEQTL